MTDRHLPPHNRAHEHSHEHPHNHDAGCASSAVAPPACSSCAADGGHDHGVLPGWSRIVAALLLGVGAEGAHWLGWQWRGWELPGMALAVLAIALAGLGVYRAGIKDLLRLRLGINALMAVAVTGAVLIGQWPEAAMVMALYVAAERLEHGAMDKARNAIRDLLDLAPPTAQVQQADGSFASQAVADVALGALLRITPGARVPLDGTVTQGSSAVNQAPITGESQWADKAPGDPLYAGSVNQHGELLMQVTAAPANSLLARIVHAVEQAQASRAPTQRFVDRFAAVYTPLVFVAALLLAALAPLLAGWTWSQALYQALALLVIACPCALVISTPVTVVSALTAGARRGLLLKGGSALEAARNLRVVALDKTGTLTSGQPSLVQWQALVAEASPLVAQMAWQLASRSEHPVSRAITRGLERDLAQPVGTVPVDAVQAQPGRGVQADVAGQRWYLGNLRWMQELFTLPAALLEQLAEQEQQGRSVTLLADANAVQAWFAVADALRPQARQAIEQLRQLGLHTVMLSGDNQATVSAVAKAVGMEDARGALLPEDKLRALADLQQRYGATAMTGDGMNDAPALAQADMGIAMGGAHSSALAMDSAALVLMHDDLRGIAQTIDLSQRAHRVLWQNISLALGVKAGFVLLALSGMATMWLAVLADVGVTLLVVLNGLRLRRWNR